jgi:uncharacterized protein (TIGR02001 family)
MKSFGIKLSLAAMLLAGAAATSVAYADDAPAAPPAPAWGTLTGYVAVTNDYRFRGITQDKKDVSPQGSLNWTGPDGFYAGTWLSKVNWDGHNNPSLEMDIYAGKHFDLDGTDLNVEAYYYSYPEYSLPGPAASYYETIVQLSHTFGPLTLTATGANSPEWSLDGGTGWYAEGTASYAVNDWLSISGNLGHQWVAAAPSDYTHYDIGATATWKSLTLDARYVGTDIKAADTSFWIGVPKGATPGFVATLTYNFNLLP